MSAAIHTRYGSGARGSYIRAWTKDGKGGMALRLPYPHELHHAKRHPAAAKALADRLGWSGLWIVGHNDDNSIVAVQPLGPESGACFLGDVDFTAIEGEDYFIAGEGK
jgi:hypothetical protein